MVPKLDCASPTDSAGAPPHNWIWKRSNSRPPAERLVGCIHHHNSGAAGLVPRKRYRDARDLQTSRMASFVVQQRNRACTKAHVHRLRGSGSGGADTPIRRGAMHNAQHARSTLCCCTTSALRSASHGVAFHGRHAPEAGSGRARRTSACWPPVVPPPANLPTRRQSTHRQILRGLTSCICIMLDPPQSALLVCGDLQVLPP